MFIFKKYKFKFFKKKMCPICHEIIKKNKIKTFDCKHTFHYSCIKEWFNFSEYPTCPMCRSNQYSLKEKLENKNKKNNLETKIKKLFSKK